MITELTQGMHGRKISCKIKETQLDGILIYEDARYYILNDKYFGTAPYSGTLQFKYSWCVGNGSDIDLNRNYTSDIRFEDEVVNDYSIF